MSRRHTADTTSGRCAVKPPVCGPCQDEQGRWLDSKPSRMVPRLGIAHGSGAPYDASPAGIRDARRARYEAWRTLVREQTARIGGQCRAAGHVTPPVTPAAVQPGLFELVGGVL